MMALFRKWKCGGKKQGLFLFVLLAFRIFNCDAQKPEKLPDSVAMDQVIESPVNKDSLQSNQEHRNGSNADSAAEKSDEEEKFPEDSVKFRMVPDSVVSQMKRDKDFSYANNPAFWAKDEPDPRNDAWFRLMRWLGKSVWFSRLLYIILGAILLFTIYVIAVRNRLFIFYASPQKKQVAIQMNEASLGADFSENIRSAIASGNFRLAVRYMYLKTLKMADKKGLIKFKIQSTNQEYLGQLQNQAIGRDFAFLTSVYEWIWYGAFEIDRQQFTMISQAFDNLYKKIGH